MTLGLAYIGLPALVLGLFVMLAAAGAPNSPLIFPIAFTLATLGVAKVQWKASRKKAVAIATFYALTVAGMLAVAAYFFDNSWDGQTYHQEIVIKIAKDWNPIRNLKDPVFQVMAPWYNAKGHEFLASAIYSFTKNIESSKAINLLLLFGSFFLSLELFKALLSKSKAAAFAAFVAAMNPVTVVQLATFYVDGAVGSTFLCLLSSVGLLLLNRKTLAASFGVVCAVVLLLNLKLSTVCILVVTVLTTLAFSILYFRNKARTTELAKVALIAASAALLVGINPYALNFWQLVRHPVQSLKTSSEGVKLVGRFAPPDFNTAYTNQLTKIGAGIFGKTNNSSDIASGAEFEKVYSSVLLRAHPNLHPFQFPRDPVQLAAPFTLSQRELELFKFCDIRIGGFGPWFGELLIGTIIFATAIFFKVRKIQLTKETSVSLFFAVVVTVATVAIEHAWWARFVPQLWLLPILTSVAIYLWSRDRRCAEVTLYGILGMLLANTLLVLVPNWTANWQDSQTFHQQLEVARNECESKRIINIFVPKFVSLYPTIEERLKEAHVPCRLVDVEPKQTDYCYRVTDLPIFCYAAKVDSKLDDDRPTNHK